MLFLRCVSLIFTFLGDKTKGTIELIKEARQKIKKSCDEMPFADLVSRFQASSLLSSSRHCDPHVAVHPPLPPVDNYDINTRSSRDHGFTLLSYLCSHEKEVTDYFDCDDVAVVVENVYLVDWSSDPANAASSQPMLLFDQEGGTARSSALPSASTHRTQRATGKARRLAMLRLILSQPGVHVNARSNTFEETPLMLASNRRRGEGKVHSRDEIEAVAPRSFSPIYNSLRNFVKTDKERKRNESPERGNNGGAVDEEARPHLYNNERENQNSMAAADENCNAGDGDEDLHVCIVRMLLADSRVDVNAVSWFGCTALHRSLCYAIDESDAIARLLLSTTTETNHHTAKLLETPPSSRPSSAFAHRRVVDVTIASAAGETPLMLAVQRCNADVVNMILDALHSAADKQEQQAEEGRKNNGEMQNRELGDECRQRKTNPKSRFVDTHVNAQFNNGVDTHCSGGNRTALHVAISALLDAGMLRGEFHMISHLMLTEIDSDDVEAGNNDVGTNSRTQDLDGDDDFDNPSSPFNPLAARYCIKMCDVMRELIEAQRSIITRLLLPLNTKEGTKGGGGGGADPSLAMFGDRTPLHMLAYASSAAGVHYCDVDGEDDDALMKDWEINKTTTKRSTMMVMHDSPRSIARKASVALRGVSRLFNRTVTEAILQILDRLRSSDAQNDGEHGTAAEEDATNKTRTQNTLREADAMRPSSSASTAAPAENQFGETAVEVAARYLSLVPLRAMLAWGLAPRREKLIRLTEVPERSIVRLPAAFFPFYFLSLSSPSQRRQTSFSAPRSSLYCSILQHVSIHCASQCAQALEGIGLVLCDKFASFAEDNERQNVERHRGQSLSVAASKTSVGTFFEYFKHNGAVEEEEEEVITCDVSDFCLF